MEKYVLDACALIAYINDEEGARTLESVLFNASRGMAKIFMHKINLLEIYYGDYRESGKEAADDLLDDIRKLPIEIISELSDDTFNEAGRLKAAYRMSLADAIAVAEASVHKRILLTADHHELDVVEKNESVLFQWIR